MKGYFIGRISVHDKEVFKEYAKKSSETVAKYQGKYLARGGKYKILEGNKHERHVIIEFPNFEAAVNFYNSNEYGEAKAIRKNKAEFHGVAVEGF